jgi:hypothetical protein
MIADCVRRIMQADANTSDRSLPEHEPYGKNCRWLQNLVLTCGRGDGGDCGHEVVHRPYQDPERVSKETMDTYRGIGQLWWST